MNTVKAVGIEYDARTDIRQIALGAQPTRIRIDAFDVIGECSSGWGPYTHLVQIRDDRAQYFEFGFYHVVIDAIESVTP